MVEVFHSEFYSSKEIVHDIGGRGRVKVMPGVKQITLNIAQSDTIISPHLEAVLVLTFFSSNATVGIQAPFLSFTQRRILGGHFGASDRDIFMAEACLTRAQP